MPSNNPNKEMIVTFKESSGLTKAGQHPLGSQRCISTSLDGKPCGRPTGDKYVPYCKVCMKKGDPSLKVIKHDRFGKALVSNRKLPVGYKFALFGDVLAPENMPEKALEWGFEAHDGTFVNPCDYGGSVIQFCQCPGPNELPTVDFAQPYAMIENIDTKGPRGGLGAMVFTSIVEIPKSGQLNMMYEDGEKNTEIFFNERGLTRCDVWMKEYPTRLKKGKTEADLELDPVLRAERVKAAAKKKKMSAAKKTGGSSKDKKATTKKTGKGASSGMSMVKKSVKK